jgi:hypothetical protein
MQDGWRSAEDHEAACCDHCNSKARHGRLGRSQIEGGSCLHGSQRLDKQRLLKPQAPLQTAFIVCVQLWFNKQQQQLSQGCRQASTVVGSLAASQVVRM